MGFIIFFIILAIIIWGVKQLNNSNNEVNNNQSSQTMNNQKQQYQDVVTKILDEPVVEGDSFYNTYIAGINFNANESCIGAFVGCVVAEPNNQYDKNAIAVYSDSFGKLGYIGKGELKDFRKWNKGLTWTCVGYVDHNSNGDYKSSVKIIKPYNKDFVYDETKSYLEWAKNKYGIDFVSQHLRTKYDIN